MPREDHIVHMEEVSTSIWQTKPYKRASGKAEGRKLTCRGLTFFPLDATVPLLHLVGNLAEFSRQLFPRIAS